MMGRPKLAMSTGLAPGNVRGIIDSCLSPEEHGLVATRRHPASFLGPFCLLALVAASAGLLTAGTFPANSIILGGAWATCVLLFFTSLGAVKYWSSAFLVITERRLLLIGGRGNGGVTMVPGTRINGLIFRRSLPGRLVGYGTFIIKWNGRDAASRKARFIPYPEMLYLEICNLIFPGNSNENDIDQTGRFYPGVYRDRGNLDQS